MIYLKNINLKGGDKILIEDGEFNAHRGQLTVICGQSGCGKSTLLYEIGYVFQTSDLFDKESVLYNVNHFASLVNKTITKEDLYDYLHLLQLKIDINQKIKELSGGERQRVAILCALVKEASLLVLDEITSALDTDNEERILKILKELALNKNMTIIMASHSAKAKEYADKVYEMKNHKLICIKENKIEDKDHHLFLHKSLKLSIKQYLQYTLSYFHRYLFLNLLLIFAMTCGLAFLSFLDYYDYYFRLQILDEVNDLSYNELWVYDGEESFEENKKIKEDILKLVGDVDIYPYFTGNIMIGDIRYNVVPFYLDKKNSSLLSYESNNETGLFISQKISDEKEIMIHNQMINIQGLFKGGVRLYNSGYEFVGVSEEMSQYIDHLLYNGYLVRVKDYSKLVDVYQILSDQTNYNIDSSMQDISLLEKYRMEANHSMNKYYIASFIFISFLFSIFYILYYHSRKVELAYLKVNGYTNSQLAYLLAYENLFRYCISALTSLLVTVIIKLCVLHMNVLLFDIFIETIIYSLLFVMIPFLISCIYVFCIQPIKVYRS